MIVEWQIVNLTSTVGSQESRISANGHYRSLKMVFLRAENPFSSPHGPLRARDSLAIIQLSRDPTVSSYTQNEINITSEPN